MRAALAVSLLLVAGPAAAATGQDLFNDNCGGCHGTDAASNPTAPTLKGVVGRKIASLGDFQYSDALKKKAADTWSEANLDLFLANPDGFAPGNAMFGGAPDPVQRKAIIAYLKTVK